MQMMIALRSHAAVLAVLVFSAAVCAAILAAIVLLPGRNVAIPLGRAWSRWTLRTAGVRVIYDGAEHVCADRAAVYVANHQSMLDIPVLAPVLPVRLRFIAKQSLRRIPLFGSAMSASGACVFIDRGDREEAVRSLSKAGALVRRGDSVLIFPEGSRGTHGAPLRPFKKGAFHLAEAAQVPIVPVAISGTQRLMPSAAKLLPGEVRVRFASPMTRLDDEDIDDYAARVRRAVDRMLMEMN